jgi:hypothetical protein
MLAFDKRGDREHLGGGDDTLPTPPVDSDLKHVFLPPIVATQRLAALEKHLLDGSRKKAKQILLP